MKLQGFFCCDAEGKYLKMTGKNKYRGEVKQSKTKEVRQKLKGSKRMLKGSKKMLEGSKKY